MKESFDDIFNTNPKYSTTIGFILGMALIADLTAGEQNMVGNWLILVGQTILTNAASQGLIQSRITGGITNINSKEIKCMYNPFIYDINKIKDIIHKVYPDNNVDLHKLKDSLTNLEKIIDKLKEK